MRMIGHRARVELGCWCGRKSCSSTPYFTSTRMLRRLKRSERNEWRKNVHNDPDNF